MNHLLKSKFYLNKLTFSKFGFSNLKAFCTNVSSDNSTVILEKSSDLEKIISTSKIPVIVDFYADWCPPCKKLTPVLEQKQKDTKSFKLVKVNVDNHPDLSEKYNVQGIPHVVSFKDGKKLTEFAGFNEAALNKMIGAF